MTVELKQKQAFIGVKAIAQSADNKRVEVMYAPTQIENLWGQAEKLSVGIFLVFSVALAIIITIVIIVSTKIARRGYRPISSDEWLLLIYRKHYNYRYNFRWIQMAGAQKNIYSRPATWKYPEKSTTPKANHSSLTPKTDNAMIQVSSSWRWTS